MDTDQRFLEKFIQSHTGEAMHIIERLGVQEIASLLTSIPSELSSLLLGQMDRFKAARCLENMSSEIAIKQIGKLDTSIAALILRQLDKDLGNLILEGLSPEDSRSLRLILSYPDNTVGSYINPLVFTLYEDLSIGAGLERVKEDHPHIQSNIIVLSRDQLLVGFIELKELLTTDKKKLIRAVMNSNPPKILADLNISVLLEGRGWDESYSSLPVVDLHGILLGIIERKTLSKIKPKEKTLDRQADQAGMALGDLYQIGFSGLVRSASEIIWELKSK